MSHGKPERRLTRKQLMQVEKLMERLCPQTFATYSHCHAGRVHIDDKGNVFLEVPF